MGNREAEEFRRSQSIRQEQNKRKQINNRDNKIVQFPEKYVVKQGSAKKAKMLAKRRKKLKLRIAAILLGAGIGLGSISAVGHAINNNKENLTTLAEKIGNEEIEGVGLRTDTEELLQKCEKQIKSLNEQEVMNLTDDMLIEIVGNVETLNFNTIKDKVANLKGLTRNDITLKYNFENGDGKYYATIKVGDEMLSSGNALPFGIGEKNHIPKEIADLIIQIGDYEKLVTDLKTDKITKINAIKEINKLAEKVMGFAEKDLTIDNKGNIEVKEHEAEKDKEEER